jgi:hypothetical protein
MGNDLVNVLGSASAALAFQLDSVLRPVVPQVG